jgi:hypothetical protein
MIDDPGALGRSGCRHSSELNLSYTVWESSPSSDVFEDESVRFFLC